MKPRKTDKAYLWDMREAAIEAQRVLRGRNLQEFLADGVAVRAIERLIEIIGEAASKVSEATRAAQPGIPWTRAIGQRHVLAHDYGEIDHARLYAVVVHHLGPPVATLDGCGLEPSALRPEGEKTNL